MVDVAREAGVALRTVSRVVNNDPTVSEQLAERVRAAIAALDYRLDERARQLRAGTTMTIGAAVRNISDAHPVLRAVDETARQSGFTVIAMSTEDDQDREREAVLLMCSRRLDGIIIEPIGSSHEYLQPEIDMGMPVVAFDRPAAGVDVDTVLSDNRGGIELAFRHMVEHGHRRIAYIGDDERIYTGRERAQAFRDCAKANGSPLTGLVHPGPVTADRVAEVLRAVLRARHPATAIVAGNSQTSVEIIRQLGADYSGTSLLGFDDFPLADLLQPPLTVIAQDNTTVGRTAVELLRTRGDDPGRAGEVRTVATALVARGSVHRPR